MVVLEKCSYYVNICFIDCSKTLFIIYQNPIIDKRREILMDNVMANLQAAIDFIKDLFDYIMSFFNSLGGNADADAE